jgi:hypothetical protein
MGCPDHATGARHEQVLRAVAVLERASRGLEAGRLVDDREAAVLVDDERLDGQHEGVDGAVEGYFQEVVRVAESGPP